MDDEVVEQESVWLHEDGTGYATWEDANPTFQPVVGTAIPINPEGDSKEEPQLATWEDANPAFQPVIGAAISINTEGDCQEEPQPATWEDANPAFQPVIGTAISINPEGVCKEEPQPIFWETVKPPSELMPCPTLTSNLVENVEGNLNQVAWENLKPTTFGPMMSPTTVVVNSGVNMELNQVSPLFPVNMYNIMPTCVQTFVAPVVGWNIIRGAGMPCLNLQNINVPVAGMPSFDLHNVSVGAMYPNVYSSGIDTTYISTGVPESGQPVSMVAWEGMEPTSEPMVDSPESVNMVENMEEKSDLEKPEDKDEEVVKQLTIDPVNCNDKDVRLLPAAPCIKTGMKQMLCFICGETFGNHQELSLHERGHLQASGELGKMPNLVGTDRVCVKTPTKVLQGPYQCKVCGKHITERGNLKKHMRIHTGEKPYKCSLCSKTFSDCSVHLRHERHHFGERPFECEICDKKFQSKESLTQHIRLHTGEKPYICHLCGTAFAGRNGLVYHIQTHTSKEKTFECTVCARMYRYKLQLLRHCKKQHTAHIETEDTIKEQEQRTTFQCPVCGKIIYALANLIKHVRIHTGPFQCQLCGKSFSDSSVHSQHMKTHSVNASLANHFRTHTGKQPLVCEKCGKWFALRSKLDEHIETHAGEKS